MISIQKFLNEDQDPKDVEKVLDKLQNLLMTGEEVEYIAVQKKPAVNLMPESVALTSRRLLFVKPKNLGLSLDFQDFPWTDIQFSKMKEGMLGAEYTATTTKGETISVDYLPKAQARKLYALSQEKEQQTKEFIRQQELEEKRASSGQVHAPEPKMQGFQDDNVVAMQKLKNLLDNGLISVDDFEKKKAEILSRI